MVYGSLMQNLGRDLLLGKISLDSEAEETISALDKRMHIALHRENSIFSYAWYQALQ